MIGSIQAALRLKSEMASMRGFLRRDGNGEEIAAVRQRCSRRV